MNFKKIIIIILLLISILLGLYLFVPKNNNTDNSNSEINNKIEYNNEETIPMINFIKSISGLKAKNMELIDNPVGIKGEFVAPIKSILNGVDYFLKHTENDKMTNVKVDLGDGYISVKVDYKIINKITTPIEVKVVPTLNENKDLELKLGELKFLDVKIADWIVNIALNTFVKDWFPKDLHMKLKKGSVVIYKDNFKGVSLDGLKVDSTGLNIGMTIDLSTIINDIYSKNKQ